MAVYERTYRPYAGPLTGERSRFLVLPRYAYQEVFSRKLFIAFFVSCFVWPLILAIMIYIPHNANFLKYFSEEIGTGFALKFDAAFFFRVFLIPQSIFAFILAFIIGPALVSADMRNNAMPLYLSRPFSRWDYIVGKSLVLVVLMSLITWVPGLLLFGLQAYLMGDGWLGDHLRVGLAIVLSSWMYIVVLCLTSLAISAYVKWKPLARLVLFAVFIVAFGFSEILEFTLRSHWPAVLDIAEMMRVVWANLFGIADWSQTPVWAAWTSLIVVSSACVGLLARKIRAYEVVR